MFRIAGQDVARRDVTGWSSRCIDDCHGSDVVITDQGDLVIRVIMLTLLVVMVWLLTSGKMATYHVGWIRTMSTCLATKFKRKT